MIHNEPGQCAWKCETSLEPLHAGPIFVLVSSDWIASFTNSVALSMRCGKHLVTRSYQQKHWYAVLELGRAHCRVAIQFQHATCMLYDSSLAARPMLALLSTVRNAQHAHVILRAAGTHMSSPHASG